MKSLLKKIAIAFGLAFGISGCATTETTIMTPENERIFSMKTRTLFKDVKDVSGNASNQGFQFELGSSESNMTPEQSAALLCLFNPSLCSQ